MDRREFLTGALLTTVASSVAARANAAGRGLGLAAADSTAAAAARDPELERAVETALACLQDGNDCIRHCVDLLGQGDTTLKNCMASVLDMTAVCAGLAKLASYAATPDANLRAYAAACADYCRTCSAACKKHEGHHAPCKACMESCDECVKACEALAA
jgi:Cys-rich four helix bundle protein (predicted Tat secretion target)